MRAREVSSTLSDLAAPQWGMFTTAQAARRGVTRLILSRTVEAGSLERLAHGVYKMSGVPAGEFDELKAAWLALEPSKNSSERSRDTESDVVVSGTSAAWLHGVGDLVVADHEFTSRSRRQTRRPNVVIRVRSIDAAETTVRFGLPVTTLARMVADLVRDRTDPSILNDVLRGTVAAPSFNLKELESSLAPLARQNGFAPNDGAAFADALLERAGLDTNSTIERVAKTSAGTLIAFEAIQQLIASHPSPALLAAAESVQKAIQPFAKSAVGVMNSPSMRSVVENLASIQKAIGPSIAKLNAWEKSLTPQQRENILNTAEALRRAADIRSARQPPQAIESAGRTRRG